jgi:large subunit ribosomal protein L7/L12
VTKQEIIEAIKQMSVMDLADLVKTLEQEFGVSAAAPVAVAAAGPAAPGPEAAAPAAEEQTEFDVLLQEVGPDKIKVIKVVRELTGLGLRESKEAVDSAPSVIRKAVSKEEAQTSKAKLEEVGAIVQVK